MQELSLGEYIRRERLRQGITQEQLCEGICEPITISRMENGKQTPSYERIRAFLHRLGLPDDRYFALLSPTEMEIRTLQNEIRADMIRFYRAMPEDKPVIRSEGLKKLKKLEDLAGSDERIIRQYILSIKVIFGKPNSPYSPEEKLNILLEALRITVPNLDLEEINLSLYTLDETSLLNQIAAAYAEMGQPKKAIDIYRQLLKYVQKHYSEMSRYAGKLALIAHNYTRELFLVGRYDDAIEIAELGWKACTEYGHYQFLPGLLDLIGGCYFYKGEQEKCKEHYRCAYYIYKAIGNDSDRLRLETDAKQRLGFEFSF
jgi:transcriptional regulator with XRE-family HTH domain